MSAAKVDALGVLALSEIAWTDFGQLKRAELTRAEMAGLVREARAAVAELIEALRTTSAELEAQINDPNADNAAGFRAADRARAALARVTGGES